MDKDSWTCPHCRTSNGICQEAKCAWEGLRAVALVTNLIHQVEVYGEQCRAGERRRLTTGEEGDHG